MNEPIRRPIIFQAYTFADADLKELYYGSDSRFISEVEKCPPMIVGAQDRFLFVTSLNQSELRFYRPIRTLNENEIKSFIPIHNLQLVVVHSSWTCL